MPDKSKRVLVVYRDSDSIVPYQEALTAAGLDPVIADAREGLTLAGFDGLVLTGGSDVDPASYGEVPGPDTDPPDPVRDRVEFQLLTEALAADLPVLGICRGLQLLNVFHRGTLRQHLEPVERHRRIAGTRAEPIHRAVIEPGTLLSRIAGGSTEWAVNSRHHQAIARLGRGLLISARDPEDDMIEAVERPDKSFVLAVQWHPENQVFQFPEQLALFARFGDACAVGAARANRVEIYR